jgi:GT2 family glycosyltransferase
MLEAHPGIAALVGRTLVGVDEREDPICAQMANSRLPRRPGLPGPSVLGFLACSCVVRRAAFLEAGGFEQRLGVGGEEALLAIDLASRGWDIVYAEDVVAHHHPSPVRDPLRRRATQTRNALWTVWLRRPAPAALRLTVRLGRAGLACPSERAGLAQAVRGLPWVMARRRVVPAQLEERLRLLD